MNKRIVITVFLALLGSVAFLSPVRAQDRTERYVSHLGVSDAGTGARAVVRYDADVEAWAARYGTKSGKINGYRVCIYSDNGQDARAKASQYLNTFRNNFPGVSGETIYNTPTWKVVVGNCLNLTEATILLGKIRQNVSSNAFLYHETFDADKALNGFNVSGETETTQDGETPSL